MRMRIARAAAAVLLIAALLCGLMIHVAALDDTYRFDDYGMSIKFSKDYYVVTRDTSADDPVFQNIDYDYEGLKSAFDNDHICLFAFDPEKTYEITLTVTQDDNSREVKNYSDLTPAERKAILDVVKESEGTSSAVEIKHNGNIFIDSERQLTEGDRTVYVNLCSTVINGLTIDLAMKKYDEAITAEEAKELTNAAGSLNFDRIDRDTGAIFEWWRVLLWAAILALLSVAITVIYKHHNAVKNRKLEERFGIHAPEEESRPAHAKEESVSFDESLGYKDDEEFAVRADADEMAGHDIKIREENSDKGIEFFEDGGSSINDKTDYFDTYFEEPVEKRTRLQKITGAIVSYIKIAATHTGYFFKNLFAKIFKKKK